jgi:glycerol-3-phosphate dehydrogenase (NAD(P)+)
MTSVIILGAGVMGTSFGLPLSDRDMQVRLVGTHLDRELVEGMKQNRRHAKLNAPIGENISIFDDREMDQAFAEPADLVVVGISTPGVDWAVEKLLAHMQGTPPIVMLTKGIAEGPDGIEILPDYMARRFGESGKLHGPIGAVGGPCIAGELAVRRDTTALIGFREAGLAREWASRISTPYYELRYTQDLVGLEICAALKNFYAIGVSVPQGRVEEHPPANGAGMHNATASLFNQAVNELAEIVRASGGNADTATGLAGLGDLHVTCQAGRNSRLGRLLGAGMSFRDAMDGPLKGETVEGTLVAASLATPLHKLASAGRLDEAHVPLALSIIATVTRDGDLQAEWPRYHYKREGE